MRARCACLCLLLLAGGCGIADRTASFLSWMRPDDYRDSADDDSGQWDYVGREGRGNQQRTIEPDSWWSKYVQSEKANAIERNLGFDAR